MSLPNIKIEQYPTIKNDLIISTSSPEKDKEAVNKEKQNMKLVNKHNKEGKDSSLIEECLVHHYILRTLEKQAKQEIIKEVSLYLVKSDVELFKQGDPAGLFYILREGTCDVIVNGEKKDTIKKGNCFGDTALIYGTNREYTVKTTSDCYVWIMEKKNFKKVLDHILHITFEENNNSVGKLSLFTSLSKDQKIKLVNNLYRETHVENKTIFNQGNISNCLYILKDGGINLKKDGKIIRTLTKGDHLGLLEVLGNSNRIFEATAKEKTHLISIPTFWLNLLCGANYRSVLALSIIKNAFTNNSSLKRLNLKFLDEIFNLITFNYYEKETEIKKSGEPKNSLIIILIEGELFEASTGKIICERNNLLFGKEIYEEDVL